MYYWSQNGSEPSAGVPIPPPLVPGQEHLEEHHPLPPQRSTSATGGKTIFKFLFFKHSSTLFRHFDIKNFCPQSAKFHYTKMIVFVYVMV